MTAVDAPGDAAVAAAALARLAALSPLDAAARAALAGAAARPRRFLARQELLLHGQEIAEAQLLLGGWAARVHELEDGRRQILGLLLPGDLIGFYGYARPTALASVVAVSDVVTCAAPDPAEAPALGRAYLLSRAAAERYLLAQVTRLGRLNAHERLAGLLLEFHERLSSAGLVADDRFRLPLTQDVLADVVGLTAIHVNRTLQALRGAGFVNWKNGELELLNLAALRRSVARVTV